MVFIVLSFKAFERFHINNFQAIVFNYFICVLCGFLLTEKPTLILAFFKADWLPLAILLGFFFIVGFWLMATTAQRVGVTLAIVSSKLAMVVPAGYGLLYLNEPNSWQKMTGLSLGILSLYFITKIHKNSPLHANLGLLKIVLPLAIFIQAGVGDTIIKIFQHYHLKQDNFNEFLIFMFGTAFCIGLFFLLWQLRVLKKKYELKSLTGGIWIGIPNYFSIYFLIKALEHSPYESSIIFPINNIAVIFCSSLGAVLLFQEKLSRLNLIGLFMSVPAIWLIFQT